MESLILVVFFIIFASSLWYKDYIRTKRRQQSKCEFCGGDLGPELLVLERLYSGRGKYMYLAKRIVYRGDEARNKIKPEQPKQCLTCGTTDIKYAYIEDGSMGYWCYQCKKSLKAMKDPLYQKTTNQKKTYTAKEILVVCPTCAVSDIRSIKLSVVTIIGAILILAFLILPLSFVYKLYKSSTISKFTSAGGRFILYSNNIVLDKKTGLEWYAGPDENTSGVKAKSWIEDLNRNEFANGYWRMPTVEELKTLYQDGAGSRNMTPLLKTTGWWVWSGEEEENRLNRSYARSLHFRKCTEDWRCKENDYYIFGRVFAVRSRNRIASGFGSSKEVEVILEDGRFAAYSNGIVLDTKTGLEWYAGYDRATTGVEAKSWIEDLNKNEFANGYWRMATIEELKTLYQYGIGSRNMTPLLKTTGWWVWSDESKGSSLTCGFSFKTGHTFCYGRDEYHIFLRGFAVRSRRR